MTFRIEGSSPSGDVKDEDTSAQDPGSYTSDDPGVGNEPSRPSKPFWRWGTFVLRPHDDSAEQDWWFASTAIPLIAATVGPLANVLSIAALVVSWRMNRVPPNLGQNALSPTICRDNWDGQVSSLVPELKGYGFSDPRWCYRLNVVSLVCGFVGNFFLLANFTGKIRYIIALPVTILCWYISTALLIGITISMNIYNPPERPCQTYTQGFWYAVIAAVLYLANSMALMVNMLGYFLGHYPQKFILTEAQRTLILQTMLFFIWLAGGAGVFAKVETDIGNQGWLFTDALYFCDVTILTVGFGDFVPANDVGRGLVFPYSVGGIIMLGLVIGSISNFAGEMSKEKVVKKNLESHRQRIIERSDTAHGSAFDLSEGQQPRRKAMKNGQTNLELTKKRSRARAAASRAIPEAITQQHRRKARGEILQEEKSRFDAMRRIQHSTSKFKNYTAMTMSVIAFCMLWLAGAAVFYVTERSTQNLSYFQSLYFCYVSLLTIGYGDLAPKSNAGRPFFVVWSLLAVPAMTILISDMGDTVINKFKRGTNLLADFTVLPKSGVWRNFLNKNPWLLWRLQKHQDRKAAKKRLDAGFEAGPSTTVDDQDADKDEKCDEDSYAASRRQVYRNPPTLYELAKSSNVSPVEHAARLSRELAAAIRRTLDDLQNNPQKKYSYEEWVELTETIRFTSKKRRRMFVKQLHGEHIDNSADHDKLSDSADEDLIEWDWIGEDSPMMAGKNEPQFVMDRLCESLARYMHWVSADGAAGLRSTMDAGAGIGRSDSHGNRISTADHAVS